MNNWKVVWEKDAEKCLSKIDKITAKKIRNKVENYLTKDPYNNGKPLTGQHKGFYRYRFSDYRVIYEIKEKELIILVIKVGHRKEVY